MSVYGVIGQRRVSNGIRGQSQLIEFDDYGFICRSLEPFREDMERLVGGGGKGVEALVARWAHEHKVPYDTVVPPIEMFTKTSPEQGRGIEAAFNVRNTEIITQIDRLLVFWNGAEHTILAATSIAIKMRRQVMIFPIVTDNILGGIRQTTTPVIAA